MNSILSVPFTVGLRYARGRQRNRFGSVVAAFSVFGMALGVAALIIVLSVMNGFNREIKQRFQLVSPQLTLVPSISPDGQNPGKSRTEVMDFLSTSELVRASSDQLESFALIAGNGAQIPVTLKGIEPVSDSAVVPIAESILYGSMSYLRSGEFGIVLGGYIAQQLLVQPGDQVSAILPQVQITPAGIYPREKHFRVVAIFDSGSQLDSDLSYIHIEDANRLFRQNETDKGFRLKLENGQSEAAFSDQFREFLADEASGGWEIRSWSSNYESLFKAMAMEKVTVGLLLLIIVFVAAFNIVSGLVMMVSDKRSDMAVLRTLGASTKTVMRIFVVQGMALGMTGIVMGACLGTFLAFNLSGVVQFFEQLSGSRMFDPRVFYVSFLPSQWLLSDFLWVVGASVVLTILATIIPAWQASKITPTEALTYKQ
ncbi:MAG: lipoprotein-releasing ABC transporter permease subunit [Gammaproteobacteria bacterium]